MLDRNSATPNVNSLELCLITGDSNLARHAQCAGIERIMVDLEKLGKAQRQAGQNLFLSHHQEEDVQALRTVLASSALMVRINPPHDGSQAEVEKILSYGADIIMLPMFETAIQVHQFVDQVRGRARTSLLLENKTALQNIDSILQVPGIDEIHIGLNDLRISLELTNIFEIFCLDILDILSKKIRQAGIRFGFGGVTAPTVANLPVSPSRVIAEQARLGSTLALLGRSFRHPFEAHPDGFALSEAVQTIHRCFEGWQQVSEDDHLQSRAELRQEILRLRQPVVPYC